MEYDIILSIKIRTATTCRREEKKNFYKMHTYTHIFQWSCTLNDSDDIMKKAGEREKSINVRINCIENFSHGSNFHKRAFITRQIVFLVENKV
jgi:uncharacterized protein YdeI (YjbR/CyaY-like superfamily)